MKFQFDPHQPHQRAAIRSVIGLLEGQPLQSRHTGAAVPERGCGAVLTPQGVANRLCISGKQLFQNLRFIQRENGLPPEEPIPEIEGFSPDFSIEMETGTGKTYVYLRTIYELAQTYGFRKFIIVVPSVAIREGVLKSLAVTHRHFQELYSHEPVRYGVYDAANLTALAGFARSHSVEILVLNIDAFARDTNVIHQLRETGDRPIEWLQATRPIVLLDEPQNMETPLRRAAIASLHPLLTLRYSATHKEARNLLYRLDPVQAHHLGLVKQIEVDSVVSRQEAAAGAFVQLHAFVQTATRAKAKLTLFVAGAGGAVSKKELTVSAGDDLFVRSKGWEAYRDGFVVEEIDAGRGLLTFSGGLRLEAGAGVGGLTDAVLEAMIDAAVENHFRKEEVLRERGIKVLSLFFIDRVAHYRQYNAKGEALPGKYARWLEASFRKWNHSDAYKDLFREDAATVHDGYFSQDKGRFKDSKEGKSNRADDDTFRLIMQDKERLLNPRTPLRFLFSHSALREGWDNPNVFQICTLTETGSHTKKRQEIGRGLRLCVDASGTRIADPGVNRLTVIANEAYETFSRQLQSEMAEDWGEGAPALVQDARTRQQVRLREGWRQDPFFRKLWEGIRPRTRYRLVLDTPALIAACRQALEALPPVAAPALIRKKGRLMPDGAGATPETIAISESALPQNPAALPDVIDYVQRQTGISRDTIAQLFIETDRLEEIFLQPTLFMDRVVRIVRQVVARLAADGISYEPVRGQKHPAALFEALEGTHYSGQLVAVEKTAKTLCDAVAFGDRRAAGEQLIRTWEAREDILFYLPLPAGFRVETPEGPHTPGWALLQQTADGGQRCVVVDIRKSGDGAEAARLFFVRQHFAALGVAYRVVPEAAAV